MALAGSVQDKQILAVTLWIYLSPNFRVAVVLWSQFSDGSKRVIFKFVQLFSCCKDRNDNSQALSMSELNPEILGSFLL